MTSFDKEKGRIIYVHKLSGATQFHLPGTADEAANKQQQAPQQGIDSITSSMAAISVSKVQQGGYPQANNSQATQYPQQNVYQYGAVTSMQSSGPAVPSTVGQPQPQPQPQQQQQQQQQQQPHLQPQQPMQYSAHIQVNYQNTSYGPGGGAGMPPNGQMQPNGQPNMNTYSQPTQTPNGPQYAVGFLDMKLVYVLIFSLV
jgi:hypothetical protein